MSGIRRREILTQHTDQVATGWVTFRGKLFLRFLFVSSTATFKQNPQGLSFSTRDMLLPMRSVLTIGLHPLSSPSVLTICPHHLPSLSVLAICAHHLRAPSVLAIRSNAVLNSSFAEFARCLLRQVPPSCVAHKYRTFRAFLIFAWCGLSSSSSTKNASDPVCNAFPIAMRHLSNRTPKCNLFVPHS